MRNQMSMPIRRVLCAMLLAVGYLGSMGAQEVPIPQLSPGSARKPAPAFELPLTPSSPQSVGLSVPNGTPLQLALDQEISVKKVGQPVHALIVEPVYAFDRLVIPVGAHVTGQITKIEAISKGKRTVAALDADFTPERKVEISFNDLRRKSRFGASDPVRGGCGKQREERRQGRGVGKDQTGEGTGQTGMGQGDEAAQNAGSHATAETICRGAAISMAVFFGNTTSCPRAM